jgi:DNA-binding NarL/FixJ family response regulator
MGSGTSRRKKMSSLTLMEKMPRILLADDQQEILQAVSSLLRDECEIVGLAQNGEQVLQLAEKRSPDLLVLDISMPALSGFDVALRLKESESVTKILFLTVHDDPDLVNAAISMGALGYVLKAHLITELMPAIRSVLSDHLYVSPQLVSCLSRS